jgi:hypothetical protein
VISKRQVGRPTSRRFVSGKAQGRETDVAAEAASRSSKPPSRLASKPNRSSMMQKLLKRNIEYN